MAEEDSLQGLQALHRDLCALIDLGLPVLDRLVQNLETRLDEFKALLDKKPRNDESRKVLAAGKITIDGVEYQVNDDFKQQTLEMAEALDLDEVQTAECFMGAKTEAEQLDRSQLQTAVIRFHRRRETILLCLRIMIKTSIDNGDVEVEGQDTLEKAVCIIIGVDGSNNYTKAHSFWAKCLKSMEEIEKWLQRISETLQSAQMVGSTPLPGFLEIMNFQRQSLTRQHENLAAICTHLIKPGYASMDNFNALLAKVRTLDRHDLITIHYVPMVMHLLSWLALEQNTVTRAARDLHNSLMAGRESDNWALRSFHAATLTWWLSEYSGRYVDPNLQDNDLKNVNFDEEAISRSEVYIKALDDGALHFMLSISQDVRPTRWYDPTKTSMIATLLQDTSVLPPDSPQPEEFFRVLLMERMQEYVEAYITNMPDTLRKLKVEEDDQRRRLQIHLQHGTGEQPFHLERFLVVVSYAYDGFPEAAEEFWTDKESNLYGFLQWAAKRQPTPRIAMFCEMLRAISTGETNAESAHKFLLEESSAASGKIRRTSSLSYTHIFNELIEFQKDIHEPRKTIQGGLYPPTQNPVDQIVEPESGAMLESYLGLLAHLCRQSPLALNWMLEYSEYNLAGIFFGLCAEQVGSTLRGAAFNAIAALLVGKDVPRATSIWNNLDDWTVTGFYVGSKQNSALTPLPREEFWAALADGYDESVAFIGLLQALVEPYSDDGGLHDTLPFPESLSSSRRMPGIEKFIDFALFSVFAERCQELADPLQRNVMRWTCLRFIVACLSTFNEDLVVFANKSNIPVDSVIETSSLKAYVTLHPFARVVEWLFNDKVQKALFAAAHHNFDEVDASHHDSPLVQSLMMSIEVMNLVMKLQATYLDIVRPVLKLESTSQRAPVSNPSLASFEDAVLGNLQLIVDLGLYCGTGHEALTVASLQLLQKLSSSRKLAVSPAGFGQRAGRSKIVGILEKDHESERIGRCLASLMGYSEEDLRAELEAGPEASAYIVKLRILEFLNSCLAAVSNRPTIAHILLGMSCDSTIVRVADDSLWSAQSSLFHAILVLAIKYPADDGVSYVSWQLEIKSQCWNILQKLWRSPLTSTLVMEELRMNELLFIQAPSLRSIDTGTPWDNVPLIEGIEEEKAGLASPFFAGSSAKALQCFLQHRAAFLDYECRELRLTAKENMPTTKSRIQEVILGNTLFPGMEPEPNLNIFDLFDFIELQFPERSIPDQHKFLEGVDLSICQNEKDGVVVYAIPLLEQLFLLRMKAWRKEGAFRSEEEEHVLASEGEHILDIFHDYNRRVQLHSIHKDILRSWVQLMIITLQNCEFEPDALNSFILQALQVILPKLEMAYSEDIFTSLQLASLAETLIQKIDFKTTAFEKTRSGDFGNDRLAQLFRASLAGIYSPVTTVELREYCYQICFRYIQGTSEKATKGSPLGTHILNSVKNCGNHLLEVICDDAYSGQGTCRITALLLLASFVAVAARQESKYVLETFVSLNFIGVLIDNLKHIPKDLSAAAAPQVLMLLSYYDASLALLLRISQTRLGAAYVLNAGLFPAIRESNIFDVDPDIGLEFDTPNAHKKYYDLMLAVLRVVTAAVISRGLQNEQTIFQAREFLKLNRNCMVSIFKRSVNVGVRRVEGAEEVLEGLVDCFTVLIKVTGFLEFEDSSSVRMTREGMFS
ncbi:hypothetical protein P154DRAFT_472086 [Amniculicola lignicola CBS 123094]|uniref:Nuclear pore complex subunit Nup192 n=1 Tax=Amniculicola lignicola CBS 123094 TaxID=1392246 RepID=A0A6A5W7M7_9PLEO|nr:hypothetical protein P154DRAFT_472086 [Amniculicola lignicola CBS 123094]